VSSLLGKSSRKEQMKLVHLGDFKINYKRFPCEQEGWRSKEDRLAYIKYVKNKGFEKDIIQRYIDKPVVKTSTKERDVTCLMCLCFSWTKYEY
jgi:hypothetical protein